MLARVETPYGVQELTSELTLAQSIRVFAFTPSGCPIDYDWLKRFEPLPL